ETLAMLHRTLKYLRTLRRQGENSGPDAPCTSIKSRPSDILGNAGLAARIVCLIPEDTGTYGQQINLAAPLHRKVGHGRISCRLGTENCSIARKLVPNSHLNGRG